MRYTESEEIELLSLVKKGDQQAFALLFYAYKDKLLGFLLRITGSGNEAEDIVQEVFLKIWQDREKATQIKNLNAYIFKIAQNRMIDNLRKFSREKLSLSDIPMDVEEVNAQPDDILVEKERNLMFQEAVNQLSGQQKKIYLSHREQGVSLKDIAKENNLALSTVQNHINRALNNIREHLSKKIDK
ncbi:MAG: ECF RNA polymerase sigma factor RpoE [Candidatus Ordinivivax streblomastigis]|uniref:RNA polymerase sigma factor n=1 Tax=Candidatus Ordinivivax streblomastigis TaxID=2540710 RepID=A0A5M8NZ99_9BACT|nr:MAG: ECF RNA polymerase sigma factor RpoE [Candidatus Ordinivivax streblomastigis]